MIVILLLWLQMTAGEKTVLVTPRPRWLPAKFAYEPKGDPSNPAIPSMIPVRRPVYNLRVISAGPNSIISATLPLEHRHHVQKAQEVLLQPVSVHRLASPFVAAVPSSLLSKPIVVAPQRAVTLQPIVVPQQQTNAAYLQQTNAAYLQQANNGLVQQQNPGFIHQSNNGFAQQSDAGYVQQQNNGVSKQASPRPPSTQFVQNQRPGGKAVSFPVDRPPSQEANRVHVESVPSLSIKLEENNQALQGLPDYLTPPRFPSVYEDELIEYNDASKSPKTKKKNKKKKQKLEEDSKENEENLSDSKSHKFKTQSSGERVEFQLHGQNGPESYKFGFDTGAGKNRQFRYEEKDAAGNVKGRFGYYDTTGKLQVVNYRADENGFHAEQAD